MPRPPESEPNRDAPMPAPSWKPKPIREPDPDQLPDEAPLPNPDESEGSPKHAAGAVARCRQQFEGDHTIP
ncbi:hypothetical protein FJW03_00835 [Mesorhizobium sp. B4-1-4]|nr:hypothetical protein [Mesorhizobium sp. B4-1-4]UCI32044.1 hypothetical protein FJW03_00835 [Mesorhizobium sp. B4-1-4]